MMMGEETSAPKILSSVSIMHIKVGPLVVVEQILQNVFIDIFHEHDISIPVQVGEAVPMGACGVDQSPITGSNSGW